RARRPRPGRGGRPARAAAGQGGRPVRHRGVPAGAGAPPGRRRGGAHGAAAGGDVAAAGGQRDRGPRPHQPRPGAPVGCRGRGPLAALARAAPDAGGVHVGNDGAAALALVTLVLAAGRSVVVARGELVEIGDGFRIPELLESVGARLREVGTTNRVRLEDY